jgi:hypothetical protein
VQVFVNERFRGRVMGIYAIFFVGMMPVGSLAVGWLAEVLGPMFGLGKATALRLAVLASLEALAVATFFVGTYWRKVRDQDSSARTSRRVGP